ncbi:hypothetical protein K2173_019869 [Erythroxylum novogranatense]|uniref:Uncharacterized protein n=1 Tax=Erythroxylum novogranatense TaxID=1862640 RepID=A0AAV8SN56_9ROSI|nr:hypothetical protein K2173_019869 [Erythroxylum novogranatense]
MDSKLLRVGSHVCNQFSSEILYFISGVSPCCNSSIESTSCLHRLSPSLLQDSNCSNGPDDDEDTTMPNASIEETSQLIQPNPSFVSRHWQPGEGASDDKCQKAVEEASLHKKTRGNLKQVLIACARAFFENNNLDFDRLPMTPGAYLIEGLVARKELSRTNIYRVLRCRELESKDTLSYMHICMKFPHTKFDHMAPNRAIAKACRNEDRIHIIDFQIAQGTQLDGAPYIRITGIDDPVNKYGRGDGLRAVGRRLVATSGKFNILDSEMLEIKPAKLVVNFPLQLHHTPDESVDMTNPRDGLLRMVKSLNPKLTIFVEQESNTNTTPFWFCQILAELYVVVLLHESAAFCDESDVKIPAKQGRHVGGCVPISPSDAQSDMGFWGNGSPGSQWLDFAKYPLSSYVNSVIRSLLRCYSEHYTLVEKDGAMLLGWKDRNLISASAWR